MDEGGMMRYIRLRTKVTRAEWHEDRSKWMVRVEERDEDKKVVREWDDECDFLLNGNGVLNYVVAPPWYIIMSYTWLTCSIMPGNGLIFLD